MSAEKEVIRGYQWESYEMEGPNPGQLGAYQKENAAKLP